MADSPLNKANQLATAYAQSNMGGATYGKKPKDPTDDVPEVNPEAAAQFQQGMGSSPMLERLKAMFGQK